MVATREWIIAEIQRLAAESGGTAPGRRTFVDATGIPVSDWEGRYWARWGDALTDAGLTPNTLQARRKDEEIIQLLAGEVRRLGHLPTRRELQLRRRDDPSFPSANTFVARGSQATLARLVLAFCRERTDYSDVVSILEDRVGHDLADTADADTRPVRIAGYVYLIKSGKSYKVGYSTDVQRRMLQLNTGMPEAGELVHMISTDDPEGIERYWHTRFAARRRRPDAEWFDLTADDVRAFRRRKFM